MEETKHKIKIKRHSRRNWHAAAACLLSIALLVCLSTQYLSFVSKTIYAESTEHLEELLHKSNNMLSMIVKKNTSYLHVWNGFLSSDPDDASTQAYLESAQQQLGFAEFYFLSYDGNYMTPSGKTGYLGLQSNLDELLSDQKDVVLNTALPGQDPMLVFICPETKGIYRGFAYDAIAISHYNNVVMKAVDDSAFGGAASSFVIYPDGQVVIENISEGSESIYNFVAILQEYSDLTEAQIQELTDDFAQGITGNCEVTLDGTRFYMVYESTGIQNWILVGLVPRDTVNAAMNQLWRRTVQIVALVVLSIAAMVLLMVMHRGRTKLRRQNTAILYRDVLFEKLSQNVDDVFLLLDAQKHRADYVSPNIERLLGLTLKSVRKNIGTLALLYPADFPGLTKNYLEGLACGDQREWDTEFVHQKTGEHRWFHVVAMGSEVEGQTKHILVLSDRTADRQANQALSDAVAAAENANRAKSTFLVFLPCAFPPARPEPCHRHSPENEADSRCDVPRRFYGTRHKRYRKNDTDNEDSILFHTTSFTPLPVPFMSQCRRLILHRIHKEKGQTDIQDAGQRQQHTDTDTEDAHGFVSAQIFTAQHDADNRRCQQHHSKPKRHIAHLLYAPRNTSIIFVNHVSSQVKRRRSCAGSSRPLPMSKKPCPL